MVYYRENVLVFILKILSVILIRKHVTVVGAKSAEWPVTGEEFYNELKIIGGRTAERGEIPFQVAIWYESVTVCGGSIVSPYFVVSAAHCFPEILDVDDVTIVAGCLDRKEHCGQYRDVEIIVKHPNYSKLYLKNDIALVKVEDKFVWTKEVMEIPYATRPPPDGTICVISGWGVTATGKSSKTLLMAAVNIKSIEECCDNYTSIQYPCNLDTIICASDVRVDSCKGDSGGPLVCYNQLVGITSYGIGCATDNLPGVYTNVSHYIEWLETATIKNKSLSFTKNNLSIIVILSVTSLYYVK